jgi:hypothetical protein
VQPTIVQRDEQPYVGRRETISMAEFARVADHLPTMFDWLGERGVAIQGYCVVGLVLVTASMRSCGRRLARRVARAMLASPLPRWYPIAVLRSVANTAGPLPVRA